MSVLPAIPPGDAGYRIRAYVLGFLEERFKDDAVVLAAIAEGIVKGIEADSLFHFSDRRRQVRGGVLVPRTLIAERAERDESEAVIPLSKWSQLIAADDVEANVERHEQIDDDADAFDRAFVR